MNRTTILETASDLINGDRQSDYGPPDRNFHNIAERWSQLLGVQIEPWQVGVLLADMKLARIASSRKPHLDSLTDACGYLALAGELSDG